MSKLSSAGAASTYVTVAGEQVAVSFVPLIQLTIPQLNQLSGKHLMVTDNSGNEIPAWVKVSYGEGQCVGPSISLKELRLELLKRSCEIVAEEDRREYGETAPWEEDLLSELITYKNPLGLTDSEGKTLEIYAGWRQRQKMSCLIDGTVAPLEPSGHYALERYCTWDPRLINNSLLELL